MLPEDRFVRIHRSYIVAVDKIKSFTRQNVLLVSGGDASCWKAIQPDCGIHDDGAAKRLRNRG